MANQSEILQFFEMMTKRAISGEFRFVMVGTIDIDGNIRTTIAGMATDGEGLQVADELYGQILVNAPT